MHTERTKYSTRAFNTSQAATSRAHTPSTQHKAGTSTHTQSRAHEEHKHSTHSTPRLSLSFFFYEELEGEEEVEKGATAIQVQWRKEVARGCQVGLLFCRTFTVASQENLGWRNGSFCPLPLVNPGILHGSLSPLPLVNPGILHWALSPLPLVNPGILHWALSPLPLVIAESRHN